MSLRSSPRTSPRHPRRLQRSFALLVFAAVVAGCQENPSAPEFCTGEARPGLRVIVADDATGAAVPGARAVARDGAFEDTGTAPSGGDPVFLAYARPGTYQVTVTAEGYENFGPEQVTVTRGECHVRTEDVLARLIALP